VGEKSGGGWRGGVPLLNSFFSHHELRLRGSYLFFLVLRLGVAIGGNLFSVN